MSSVSPAQPSGRWSAVTSLALAAASKVSRRYQPRTGAVLVGVDNECNPVRFVALSCCAATLPAMAMGNAAGIDYGKRAS